MSLEPVRHEHVRPRSPQNDPQSVDALSPRLSRHTPDQIGRREAFGEFPVDRLDEIVSRPYLATIKPNARELQTRTQLERKRRLLRASPIACSKHC